MSKESRNFNLIIGGEKRGRFTGKAPKQAANKAFTSLVKEAARANKKLQGQVTFQIQECTKGSKCESYDYVGKRVELDEPTTITIGDREVTYNYKNEISRVQGGGKKGSKNSLVKKSAKKSVKKDKNGVK